jgi:hypothetical protein
MRPGGERPGSAEMLSAGALWQLASGRNLSFMGNRLPEQKELVSGTETFLFRAGGCPHAPLPNEWSNDNVESGPGLGGIGVG